MVFAVSKFMLANSSRLLLLISSLGSYRFINAVLEKRLVSIYRFINALLADYRFINAVLAALQGYAC